MWRALRAYRGHRPRGHQTRNNSRNNSPNCGSSVSCCVHPHTHSGPAQRRHSVTMIRTPGGGVVVTAHHRHSTPAGALAHSRRGTEITAHCPLNLPIYALPAPHPPSLSHTHLSPLSAPIVSPGHTTHHTHTTHTPHTHHTHTTHTPHTTHNTPHTTHQASRPSSCPGPRRGRLATSTMSLATPARPRATVAATGKR